MDFDRTRNVRVTTKRSIRWIEKPTIKTDGWGCVEIVQDKKVYRYLIRQIPADFGVGYTVEKLDEQMQTIEQYDVNLAGERESTCTCRGFSFHGHCRHTAGLLALERQGELPHCWRSSTGREK